MQKVLFSHNTDNWRTPKNLYNYFMNNGFFDPCEYLSKTNNLNNIYKEKLYINPPYSDIKNWTKFIYNNIKNLIVLLIPARTDTNYFHELLLLNPLIIFIKGRLSFNDLGTAPFPSLILIFNNYSSCKYIYIARDKLLIKLDQILKENLWKNPKDIYSK